MSLEKVYQRTAKQKNFGSAMHKQQLPWIPGTPAKPTPIRPQRVYVRKLKGNIVNLPENSCNSCGDTNKGVFDGEEVFKETGDLEGFTDDGDAPLASTPIAPLLSFTSMTTSASQASANATTEDTRIARNTKDPAGDLLLGTILQNDTSSPESNLSQNSDVGSDHIGNENSKVVDESSRLICDLVTLVVSTPPKHNSKAKRRSKQKSMAKKHRPRVVVDRKSKRIPQPKTPEPATLSRSSFRQNLFKKIKDKNPSEKRKSEHKGSHRSSVTEVEFSSRKASSEEDIVSEVTPESCRRALNFDLGNKSSDESALTTATHQCQLQNTRVNDSDLISQDDLQSERDCKNNVYKSLRVYRQNSKLPGPNFPTKFKRRRIRRKRKSDMAGIFRFLLATEDVKKQLKGSSGYNVISSCSTSKRSKRKPALKSTSKELLNNNPCIYGRPATANSNLQRMFPPRKTRTRVAAQKAKFKYMLNLIQSVLMTRRKRSKKYCRRQNLTSLTMIPICDQLPKTFKQAQTVEREVVEMAQAGDRQGIKIAETGEGQGNQITYEPEACKNSFHKQKYEGEIQPEACTVGLLTDNYETIATDRLTRKGPSPVNSETHYSIRKVNQIADADCWLTVRGPKAVLLEEGTNFLIQELESVRTDIITKKLNCLNINSGLEIQKNRSEGIPDVDLYLPNKSRGPNPILQEETIHFLIQKSESLRPDLLNEKPKYSQITNYGNQFMDHGSIFSCKEPNDYSKRLEPSITDLGLNTWKCSEPTMCDLGLNTVTRPELAMFDLNRPLDCLEMSHQPMEDNLYSMYCDYNTPVSCQEPIDLSKKTELPAAFTVEDPNAGSQSGRVVSDPIKKQKPRKKGRTPKVYVDSETLKYNQRNQSIEQYLYTDGPYSQPGALVPYQNPIAPRKKRKWKAEVDLDSESLSMWNLLTNTDEGKGKEEVGREKYTWWERERTLFRGRRDSFTARMHTFLGDRRFTQWKGSVVDSVVGVFLTQNTSDHFSSNAFMSLAERFPVQSTSNHGTSNNDLEITNMQESSGCNLTSDEPSYDLGGNRYFVTEPDQPNTGHESETETEKLVVEVERAILTDIEHSEAAEDPFVPHISKGSCSTDSSTTTAELSGFINNTLLPESYANGSKTSTCDESPGAGDITLIGMECGIQTPSLDIPNDLDVAEESISLTDTRYPFESSFDTADKERGKCCVITDCNSPAFSEDQGKCCGVTDCSSQAEAKTENCSQTCDSSQESRTTNFEPQPIRIVESQNSEMQLTVDATCINKKGSRRKNSLSKDKIEKAKSRRKGKHIKKKEEEKVDWEKIRQIYSKNGRRSLNQMDSIDWEAVRQADVGEIAAAIKERGQNNIIAARIKKLFDRLVKEHPIGIDLEWLRDLPPELAKKFLLEVDGLGLKSVECLRLLSLGHNAFPVDTNVARIAVRLGWVPLQPFAEPHIHLLSSYPDMDSIQRYLWPRLCTLDQRTLYELHYHMITFGKAICTKKNPNCNVCPMRGECKHFASAIASARLALPGPSEKRIVSSTVHNVAVENPIVDINPKGVFLLEANPVSESGYQTNFAEPVIEEPVSPELESAESSIMDIEDATYDDQEEIPTIQINEEELKTHIQNYLESNIMLQDCNLSNSLVALTAEAASIPSRKLKHVSRLRTEHQAYELPDGHPILTEILKLEKREKDDPSPYLLAIWTPGETANSLEPPKSKCNWKGSNLCKDETCFSCNCVREEKSDTVRGTVLIPCRTAMRGSFPLNGTYFQVNEVFADHETSEHPIDVPRKWIYGLTRRTVYFGTSTSTILRGLSLEEIQQCFWHGFVCIRGLERNQRAPKPLVKRFHCPAHKKNEDNPEKRRRRKDNEEQGMRGKD